MRRRVALPLAQAEFRAVAASYHRTAHRPARLVPPHPARGPPQARAEAGPRGGAADLFPSGQALGGYGRAIGVILLKTERGVRHFVSF